MKIEKGTPPKPFAPIVITVETDEERMALFYLGCSSHVSIASFRAYHESGGEEPSGFGSQTVLEEVLGQFLAKMSSYAN